MSFSIVDFRVLGFNNEYGTSHNIGASINGYHPP
jgi:hypothetical protein